MATSYKKKVEKLSKEVKPKLEKELYNKFEEFRMQGVHIGWNAFAIQAIDNIKNMNTIDEVVAYFQAEADKAKEKLGLNFDNNKKV